ncbi:MAG TPA: glycoside hydrolase family 32 protein [Dermatophilaceae bacterium]|nr:glycoside hydrolase family 32 protein [Dermatophilaceae bacterium]
MSGAVGALVGGAADARSGRPRVHLTAPSGWLNDPLGVTYRDGLYHLFFQSLPGATAWAPQCQWAHAVSPDLVRWEHRPTALVPGPDELGCWSGGVCVVPDGAAGRVTVRLFYTSVTAPDLDLGAVRTAAPLDDRWDAWERGPVVVRAPTAEDLRVFRDPVVFAEAGAWRMLVGAGRRDGTPAVLTFLSGDLDTWTYAGVLADGPGAAGTTEQPGSGPVAAGAAWECPQLFRVGDRHVLVVSTWSAGVTGEVLAALGTYRDGRLRVERWQRLTSGGGHYAPTAFVDAAGAPCLLFWVRGVGDPSGAWTGALSVPYRVTVHDDEDVVRLAPHPAVLEAVAGSSAPGLRHELVPGTGGGPDTHVLLDGPLLEVCTGTTLLALPAPAFQGDGSGGGDGPGGDGDGGGQP